jgi:hypothetical protein
MARGFDPSPYAVRRALAAGTLLVLSTIPLFACPETAALSN